MAKLLFAGSCIENSVDAAQFKDLCRTLGRDLSKQHQILIAGTTSRTADHHVAMGALDRLRSKDGGANNKATITLFHTIGDETSEDPENELFGKLKQIEGAGCDFVTFSAGGYERAFNAAIADCDVVFLIGGGTYSETIVEKAIAAKKPVLGFSSYGGAGATARTALMRVYQLFGVSPDESSVLERKTIDSSGLQSICKIIDLVHARNPWSSRKRSGILMWSSIFLIGLVIIWYTAYLQAVSGTLFIAGGPLGWAIALACLSGTAGGLARFIALSPPSHHVDGSESIRLTGKGLAAGFAVSLFIVTFLKVVVSSAAFDLNHVAYNAVFLLTSLLAFSVSVAGLTSLEKADHLLHFPH